MFNHERHYAAESAMSFTRIEQVPVPSLTLCMHACMQHDNIQKLVHVHNRSTILGSHRKEMNISLINFGLQLIEDVFLFSFRHKLSE